MSLVVLCLAAGSARAGPQDGQDAGHPEEVAPDGSQDETAPPGGGTADPSDTAPESTAASTGHIGRDAAFSYDLLDPTTNINRKQRLILHRKQDGTLPPDSVLVQGALAAAQDGCAQLRDAVLEHPDPLAQLLGILLQHPLLSGAAREAPRERRRP